MRLLFILIWFITFNPAGAFSQESVRGGAGFSTVLTIDISRIARDTLFGQRVIKDFENAQNELVEANTTIQNDLEAEEQSLVELRKTLAPVEFRKLAVEFDEKANSIRKERAELENAPSPICAPSSIIELRWIFTFPNIIPPYFLNPS